MIKPLIAFVVGIIFGLGLVVSEMMNPAKVLNFLDVAGNWDPSLIFVMGGALLVTTLGYGVVLRRPKPLLADNFALPTKTSLDRDLIAGSVCFGAGWGLTGLCPGPALVSLLVGGVDLWIFVAAMLAGMAVHRLSLGRK